MDIYHVYCAFVREGYEVQASSKENKYHVLNLKKNESLKQVVPINVKMEAFSIELLNEVVDEDLLLAFVSFDGSFTMYRCTNGINIPLEKRKF
eukprot:g1918.t1